MYISTDLRVAWNILLPSKTLASYQQSNVNKEILSSQCNGLLLTGLFRSKADSLLWSGSVGEYQEVKKKIQGVNQYLADHQTKEPSILNEAAHCPQVWCQAESGSGLKWEEGYRESSLPCSTCFSALLVRIRQIKAPIVPLPWEVRRSQQAGWPCACEIMVVTCRDNWI